MRVLMTLMATVSRIVMTTVHMLNISARQALQTTSQLICIQATVINCLSGESLKVYVLHDHYTPYVRMKSIRVSVPYPHLTIF